MINGLETRWSSALCVLHLRSLDLDIQPNITIIPGWFKQIGPSILEEEDIWRFSYITQCKIVNLRTEPILTTGALFIDFGRWCYINYTKYKSSRPCGFRQEDAWNCILKSYFQTPVTYLLNLLNNLSREPPMNHFCEVIFQNLMSS